MYFSKTALLLGPDDLLCVGRVEEVDEVKVALAKCVAMTDLGEVSNLLSILIERPSRDVVTLSQERCIEEVLEEFGMSNCKGVSTPLEPGWKRLTVTTQQSLREPGRTSPMQSGNLVSIAVCLLKVIGKVLSMYFAT